MLDSARGGGMIVVDSDGTHDVVGMIVVSIRVVYEVFVMYSVLFPRTSFILTTTTVVV